MNGLNTKNLMVNNYAPLKDAEEEGGESYAPIKTRQGYYWANV